MSKTGVNKWKKKRERLHQRWGRRNWNPKSLDQLWMILKLEEGGIRPWNVMCSRTCYQPFTSVQLGNRNLTCKLKSTAAKNLLEPHLSRTFVCSGPQKELHPYKNGFSCKYSLSRWLIEIVLCLCATVPLPIHAATACCIRRLPYMARVTRKTISILTWWRDLEELNLIVLAFE